MRAADFPYFDGPFLALAHRGGATYPANLHRENSVHAFTEAAGLGYHHLETDVHATADGVLLAFHDAILDRVTDRSGVIAELSYAEVRQARIHGIDPIPTLAELFTTFPGARFNIDAKSDTSVNLLTDTIAEHDAYDRVCVSSFGVARLHRLRRRLRQRLGQRLGRPVACAASSYGVAVNRFLPWFTWALNTPAPVLQIPVHTRVLGRDSRILTPALLRAAHRAGKQVHIWTVDDSELMERLIDAGVDGIFTDRIDTLKTVLTQRGLWAECEPEGP